MPFFLLVLPFLSGCYAAKSVVGHSRLLWNRRPLEDARAPEELKAKLKLVAEVRSFAFDVMGLARSEDFSTYTPVDGPVTWLVSASSKTAFVPYVWRFPLAGRFPYKGYFAKEDARREKARLERLGYDAAVGGAAAYNTPLWIADPLPSSALDDEPGAVAALVLHELAHGTLRHPEDMAFEESLAAFVGERGAEDFLARRFGAASAELSAYRRSVAADRAFAAALEETYRELDALYRSPVSEDEKLERREALFSAGRERLARAGRPLPELNNAVILSRRMYLSGRERLEEVYEREGGDWRRVLAALKELKAPSPGSRRAG